MKGALDLVGVLEGVLREFATGVLQDTALGMLHSFRCAVRDGLAERIA